MNLNQVNEEDADIESENVSYEDIQEAADTNEGKTKKQRNIKDIIEIVLT